MSAYEVHAFDARVAAKFAALWLQKKDHPDIQAAKQAKQTSKHLLRADCMIVSTAIVAKATRIITNNLRDLRWFASDLIDVQDIPETTTQLGMF